MKPLWDGPKTLVPVKGKPFALYQLEWLARQGVWEVVYCAGPHCGAIRDALGYAQFGMRLTYVHEDWVNDGTTSAVRTAHNAGVLAPWFFVLYGDSYLRVSLAEVAPITLGLRWPVMTVLRNDDVLAPSNVKWGWQRKARHIDHGLWAFPRETLNTLGARDLREAVGKRFHPHVVEKRFYEVGTPQGVAELESFLDLQS